MNQKDALSILNIQPGHITPADIKTAYRKAAAKFHPDHNPAGLEMMKLVNIAYETLKNYEGDIEQSEAALKNYGDVLNAALNEVIDLGFEIEVCGAWVWLHGDTKPHRELLKAAGYKWSPKKTCWYFRPEDYKSFNRSSWSMDKIRANYGSEAVNKKKTFAIGR